MVLLLLMMLHDGDSRRGGLWYTATGHIRPNVVKHKFPPAMCWATARAMTMLISRRVCGQDHAAGVNGDEGSQLQSRHGTGATPYRHLSKQRRLRGPGHAWRRQLTGQHVRDHDAQFRLAHLKETRVTLCADVRHCFLPFGRCKGSCEDFSGRTRRLKRAPGCCARPPVNQATAYISCQLPKVANL
ncbi:hypothetical protein L209DRAFT_41557 [Thermothelomyces heterothallicus CBS 203.75]